MNRKATAAAGTFLLVAACGGGTSGSEGLISTGASGSTTPSCQPQRQSTLVGGDLFVVDQAPVGVSLLSDGGLTQYEFSFYYDNVFGMPTNNPQDKWGQARPFAPGTPAATSTQVQLQPPTPDLIQWQSVPSTFPKGIPVELLLTKRDGNPPGPANSSGTAAIGKDLLGRDDWHTASVTYGMNNTATVTFFPSAGAASFSVGLTNVAGNGSAAGGC